VNGPIDPVASFAKFSTAGVEHVVIGGFAVISYGVVRVTKDLADLAIAHDDEPA